MTFFLEMSTKTVCDLVPLFKGKDWNTWSQTMAAFLWALGLWAIVNGLEEKPKEFAEGVQVSAATVAQQAKEHQE